MQQRRAAPSSCRVRSVTPGGVCPSPGPPLSAGSTTVLSGLHQCKSLRRTVFSNSEFTKGRECSLAIITSNHRASLGTCPPWSAAAWHGSPGAWAQPGGSSHTRRLGLRGRSPPGSLAPRFPGPGTRSALAVLRLHAAGSVLPHLANNSSASCF